MFNVVFPIFITSGAGMLLQKLRRVDVMSLVDVSLYVLAPSLVFISIDESKQNVSGITDVALFTLLHTLLCWGAAQLTATLWKMNQNERGTLSLTTIFGNANNYGLPVLLLAYGGAGFSVGINYVIVQIILVNSLGLYIASRSSVTAREAMQKIVKTPLIYAVLVGVLCFSAGITMPKGVSSAMHLMGNAYAAVVLIILGIQLRKTNWRGIWQWKIWAGVGLRVLVVPLLAKLCLVGLGINGLLSSVLFVQASMPAAVNATVLVEKYGGDKEMVTLTIAVTTLISFFTLPYFIHIAGN